MFVNYLKIVLRNLKINKAYSLIQLSGLGIGMMCTILIFLWVNDELKYDRFHKYKDDLYRVIVGEESQTGISRYAITPAPLAPVLVEDIPEIEEATRVYRMSQCLVRDRDRLLKEDGMLVDPSFLNMFSFSLNKGDVRTVLEKPHSVVLTKETAEKIFGQDDPLGKNLHIQNRLDVTVTGILSNVPSQSHLQFDMLFPMTLAPDMNVPLNSWGDYEHSTYVRLKEGMDSDDISQKIRKVINLHSSSTGLLAYLQPLSEIHLYSNLKYDLDVQGDIRTVRHYIMIAFFVLLIACINFANLSTARSSYRSREIGLRKVIGASRKHIIHQFFTESLIHAILSLIITFLAISSFLPSFNILSGKTLSFRDLVNMDMFIIVLGVFFMTVILSGVYPAFVLSSFRIIHTVRGSFIVGRKKAIFRDAAVLLQLTLSVLFIIAAFTVARQNRFLRNTDMGFDQNNLIRISIRTRENVQKYRSFKEALSQNTKIHGVTASDSHPVDVGSRITNHYWQGKNSDQRIYIHRYLIDFDYVETFDMTLIEGRSFSELYKTDVGEAFVINEEMARLMGLQSAVGKELMFWGREGVVIGVLKNFHFKSFHAPIEPIVMLIAPERCRYAFIRIDPNEKQSTLAFIESTYKTYFPDTIFQYGYLENDIHNLYTTEQNTGRILSLFTVFAILTAGMGLFGLASFSAERRTKEMGIRKILGADGKRILRLFCREFVPIVFLANVLAWPAGYFFMKGWLQNFAYHVDLGVWIFMGSGVLTVTAVGIAVGYQGFKMAYMSPLRGLKYE